MPVYELKTRTKTVFDGQTVPEDTTVAVIQTEQPLANVLSAAAFNQLQPVEVEPDAPLAIAARVVADAPAAAVAVKTPPSQPDPNDPDALNAADEAAERAEAARIEAEKAAAESQKTAAPIDASLEGLPARLQRALTDQSLPTREAVAAYVAEGKDLVDLDDVGTKAAEKILEWLKG